MHLVGIGQLVSAPFMHNGKKMTIVKGADALEARKRVAASLTDDVISKLRKPLNPAEPDWTLMQSLSDAGINTCPSSGMPVFDPSACSEELGRAIWQSYCCVATGVNKKDVTDLDEALGELKRLLSEHAHEEPPPPVAPQGEVADTQAADKVPPA